MAMFSGLAHGASLVFAAAAVAAAPPPELTVSEWADANRVISAESGAKFPGPWRTDLVPYLREIQDAMGVNHPAGRVVVRGGAQIAKTQAMNNAIGHMIDTAPRTVGVVCPSLDKCQQWNREQWEPMLSVTEVLQRKVLASRSRAEDGSSSLFKRFRGGFLKVVSASTAKQLQSTTLGMIVLEEPTDYPLDTNERGDPIDQARARGLAWGDDFKELAVSTPGNAGSCRISEMFEEGDQRLFYVPCKDCGCFSPLLWQHFRCDGGETPAPYFVRPCCGAILTEGERDRAVAGGLWLATYPSNDDANPAPPEIVAAEDMPGWRKRPREGRYPSFHIWQAYSPFASWRQIWEKWTAGQGHPDKLRTFLQQVLGEPFEPAMDRPQAEKIVELARHPATAKLVGLRRGIIPAWTPLITGAADVQTDRIEWAVYGWGPVSAEAFAPPAGEVAPGVPAVNGALIDWGVINLAPDDPRAWAELAQVRIRRWPSPYFVDLVPDEFGVDTGGHYTRQSYQFAARTGIKALKGSSDREAPPLAMGKRVRIAPGKVAGRVQLWHVGGHNLKRTLYFGLGQAQASVDMGEDPSAMAAGLRGTGRREPGAIFLPPEIDETIAKQISAEYLAEKIIGGKRVLSWEKPKDAANEQLDMAVYAMALASFKGMERMRWEDWRALSDARRKPPEDAAAAPLEALWSGNGQPAPAGAATSKPAAMPTERPSNPNARTGKKPAWMRRMQSQHKDEPR